jgi:CysZ protein
MFSNPVTGAAYLIRGLNLIGKPGVKRHVIIPFLINTLIFIGLTWLLADQFGAFIDWMSPSLPDWLSWLTWLLWLVFGLTAFIAIFFSFSIIANLVGSPFNSFLSAAVEKHLTGKSPISQVSFAEETVKALTGELKKLLLFAVIAILLLIVSFIPLVNLASPVLWAIFSAWMMSIEYIDYPMGNHGLSFAEIRREIKKKRVLSLGFGGAVMIATMVPLFNFLVMPVAVAGATALRVEQLEVSPITPTTN